MCTIHLVPLGVMTWGRMPLPWDAQGLPRSRTSLTARIAGLP